MGCCHISAPAVPRERWAGSTCRVCLHLLVQVRWDAVKGFHVPDLHVKECASLEELLKVGEEWQKGQHVDAAAVGCV